MALTKQSTPRLKKVGVDFPPMPRTPVLTIARDAQAMADYQARMDQFYIAHRTAILDKLGELQDQISNAPISTATTTATQSTPATNGVQGPQGPAGSPGIGVAGPQGPQGGDGGGVSSYASMAKFGF